MLDTYQMQLNLALQIFMPLAHSFSKASILFLLFQIFAVNKKMKYAICGGFVGIVADYGPNLILGRGIQLHTPARRGLPYSPMDDLSIW